LYFINSQERFVYNQQSGPSSVEFEKALILSVISESLKPDKNIKGLIRGTQDLKIEILTGEHKGEQHIIKNYLSSRFNVLGVKGQKIIVCVDTATPGKYRVTVNSYHRSPVLYAAIIVFAIVLVTIGGKKGVQSMIGLGVTFACVIFLFIPMLFQGYSPVLSSVFTAVLTSIATVFCLNGWSVKSLAAILGTTLGVVIAGFISNLFGSLAYVSGFHTEEAETLILIASSTGMNVGQLLFAGVLIASLGAVMDVAISISASMYEIMMTDNTLPRTRLFMSGMNVGRDIMGSMANTLILAFAGTSINSLVLIYAYNVNYTQLINLDSIGIEIMRGMCGSTAIVLTVPIVSLLSSWLFPMFLQKKR
jgi:uncharacterized membrane protein